MSKQKTHTQILNTIKNDYIILYPNFSIIITLKTKLQYNILHKCIEQ